MKWYFSHGKTWTAEKYYSKYMYINKGSVRHDFVLNSSENVYIVVSRILKFMIRILLSHIIDCNSTFSSLRVNLEILTSK